MTRKIPWETRSAVYGLLVRGVSAKDVGPALGVGSTAVKRWARLAGMDCIAPRLGGGVLPMPMSVSPPVTPGRGYQRQFNENSSAFIRNRLPHLGKPDVDALRNLSVAVAVDQKPFGGNVRSTVATATDIAPLLRLLFSRIGTPSAGYSNAFSFNDPSGMCPERQGPGASSGSESAVRTRMASYCSFDRLVSHALIQW